MDHVRVTDMKYQYKFKILDVLKGKKSYRKKKVPKLKLLNLFR